jgi:phospholipid/cholesterol/gamma-HCH transport system substrate-binding protein
VAITSPPSPPAAPQPGPGPAGPERHARPSRAGVTRWVAVGALGIVVLIAAYLVFSGSSGGTYQLLMADASQLVRGDQVQVGGVPVGSVTEIVLTHNYKAKVTISVESSLTPLHQGTLAEVRVPSLSSVANRYIALSPGPNSNPALPDGATLPAIATKEVTDLDQLFNTLNPRTLKGLQQFIQGSAAQYVGAGRALGESTEYFAPSISATGNLFAQLVKDQPTFTSFLVETAKAVTTIAARKEQLADLIENGNTTFRAIGSQQEALAQGLKQLPVTLRQGNTTFAGVPATVSALSQLIEASKPGTVPLITLLQHLRPLVTTATPVVTNFNSAISKPGANNDLTELLRALPALAKTLSTASPASVTALKESVPITNFFGPYAPDLSATLRTFGQAASYYDANGHYARVTPVLPDFKLGASDNLTPTTASTALEDLKTGQIRRCPGGATQPAADGSSPFTDNELLSCDPLETP